MKSSTKKQVKKAILSSRISDAPRIKEFHAMHPSMYANCDSYYIETYINIKRVVKISATSEERAGQRALTKEEDSNRWTNAGYEFVDSDFNIVEEKDYTLHRRRTDDRNTNCKKINIILD
tara:strand:+ start:290 stop:649 length:360 start_codon:yes stop_codon:yes gene_type:complete